MIVFIIVMLGLCAGTFGLYYGIGMFFEWVNDRLRQRFNQHEDDDRITTERNQ